MGGALPPELADAPPLPPAGAHVWAWFAHPATGLSATRQGTGFGPARLSRLEIQAWERTAILKIDTAYVIAAAKPKKGA